MAQRSPAQRSKDFYKAHGNVILLAEQTLYKLDRGALADMSGLFRNLFEVPQGNLLPEGLTDDNPIQLYVTSQEFDNLLKSSLHVIWEKPPSPVQRWLDVLKLGTIFDLREDLCQGAVYELSLYKEFDLPAARKIWLARTYNIPAFIEPAFKFLADRNRPLSLLSSADIRLIGLEAFEILCKVKEAVESERVLVAFHAPDALFHSAECRNHLRCESLWRYEWWDNVARQILQPATLFGVTFPNGAKRTVEKMEIVGMANGCLEIRKQYVEGGIGFDGEQEFIEAGVAELKRLLKAGFL